MDSVKTGLLGAGTIGGSVIAERAAFILNQKNLSPRSTKILLTLGGNAQ